MAHSVGGDISQIHRADLAASRGFGRDHPSLEVWVPQKYVKRELLLLERASARPDPPLSKRKVVLTHNWLDTMSIA